MKSNGKTIREKGRGTRCPDTRRGSLGKRRDSTGAVLQDIQETVSLLDIRVTRIAASDWNEYFLFPLFQVYMVETDKDLQYVREQEGPETADQLVMPVILLLTLGGFWADFRQLSSD